MTAPLPTLFSAVAALGAVLALVLLAGRLARASGLAARAGGAGPLAVRQVLALDARRRLHLLSCEGRDFVLLTGPGGDVVVGWVPPAGAAP